MNWELVLNVFGSGLFVGSFFILCGSKLFKVKIPKSILSMIVLICLITFNSLNFLFLDSIWKTAISFLSISIAYILLFNKSILQCSMAALVSCVLLALGEVSFIAIISLLNLINIPIDIADFIGGAFANLIIVLFAIIYLLIVYRPINRILRKVNGHNRIMLIITFALIVTVNCTLFYKLYFHKYQVDDYLVLNLVLLVALSYIAFILIKQQYDKSKLSDEYEKYVEYSKHSEKLVDQYSISQHENKNELIIIRSMVHKNNKELIEYLDEIISSKDNIDDAWIRYLRYLPFGGLKGIIHNKISEMKDNHINVFLNISKDIGTSKLKELTIKQNNQLSKMLGVFLDNAKEAAILSDDKEVSVSVYKDEGKITFEISNTYINDVDITKIYQVGDTSKGKGRGYGLALVDSIINENKIFTNEVKKIDKYFVQILKINI